MKSTDPGWDPLYDLDGDGDIDIVDIMRASARWGETCEQATYTYDAMGNRLSMTTPAGTLTYTYDAADRLLSTSAGTTFTWDANGNMLSKGTTTYAYDVANRLTQVVSGTTTLQFTYDGDSKRFNKTANGTATRYLYDVNTSLPVVLAETTGGADTLYTYGADLIALTAPGGAQTYYHYDGLGSTRNLSDGAGAVIVSYTYGAFGNLRLMKGSSDNTFQFTGEQTDDETGLLYLRARYYDPSVGRFTSRDAFTGFADSSQSLNRYVYVNNNSVNSVDPSGEIAYFLIAGAIGGAAGFAAYAIPTLLSSGEKWSWAKAGVATTGGAVVCAAAPLIAAGIASGAVTSLGSLSVPAATGLAVGEVGLFTGISKEILNQQIEGKNLEWGKIAFSGGLDAILAGSSGYQAGVKGLQMVDYQYLAKGGWSYDWVRHLSTMGRDFVNSVLKGIGKYSLSKHLWPSEVYAPEVGYGTGGYGGGGGGSWGGKCGWK
jgi:RHS repeat-associated protein